MTTPNRGKWRTDTAIFPKEIIYLKKEKQKENLVMTAEFG